MCQRRLCPRRQHQIGHRAARTNAFPASGAHAGVRTTAPLLVYALIYGLCSSRRPFTPSGYWLVNERSTSTLSLRSPPCEELSSLLLLSDVSLIFWYLSQGRGGTVPCVSAFAAHFKTIHRVLVAAARRAQQHPIRDTFRSPCQHLPISHPQQKAQTYACSRSSIRLHTLPCTAVAEDGSDKLGDANLKRHIGITFIDQFSEPE